MNANLYRFLIYKIVLFIGVSGHVYVLHPQARGALTIPQRLWQVKKVSNSFGRIQSLFLRVARKPLTADVKSISSKSTADHWLLASKIRFTSIFIKPIVNVRIFLVVLIKV